MHVLEDIYPNKGPISGIYTGINSSINNEVFIIGADYPFLSKNFISHMFSISNENKSIFIKNKDILNPLHAIYIKNDWEDILLKNIKLYGNYSPKKIISESIDRQSERERERERGKGGGKGGSYLRMRSAAAASG